MNKERILRIILLIGFVFLFGISFVSVFTFLVTTLGAVGVWSIKTFPQIFENLNEMFICMYLFGWMFLSIIPAFYVSCYWNFVLDSIEEARKKRQRKVGLNL